jgi:hypothetical protein
MAITRSSVTNIKVYYSESDMNAQATGDLTLTNVIEQGVHVDGGNWNEKYKIEIFTDANSVLHGLFVRK